MNFVPHCFEQLDQQSVYSPMCAHRNGDHIAYSQGTPDFSVTAETPKVPQPDEYGDGYNPQMLNPRIDLIAWKSICGSVL